MYKGVVLSFNFILASAPFSKSVRTTSVCPLKDAEIKF